MFQWSQMEKRMVPIALAVLTLGIIINFDFVVKPAFADISAYNSSFASSSNHQCDYMKGTDAGSRFYACISAPSTDSDHGVFSWVDSRTNPPTQKSINVFPQTGGCDPVFNPCNANSGSGSGGVVDKTGQLGRLKGIWCGYTDCYTLWDTADSYSNQLIRIQPSASSGAGDVTGYLNITSSTELRPLLTGIDVQYIGIGSVNVYYIKCPATCNTNTVGTLSLVQGLGVMGEVSTITTNQFFKGDASTGAGWGITSLDICWFCDGNINNLVDNKFLVISSRQGVTGNRAITVIDLATFTEQCGATNVGQTISTSQNTAITRFYNGSRWVHSSDGEIYLIDLDTCVKVKTTAYSTLGISNYITAFMSNHTMSRTTGDPTTHTFGGSFLIHHGSTGSLSTITRANMTTFNTLVNWDSSGIGAHISSYIGGSNNFNSITSRVEDRTVIRVDSTSKYQIIFLNGFTEGEGGGGGGGGGTGVDCTLPENANILICRLGGTGDSDLGQQTGEGILELSCTIVFTDCTDPDPKTNGIGLLIFVASIFVVVGMFFWAFGTRAFDMPLFIWIVIIIALSAFFTIVEIIDPVFLIISVFAVIAMAVPKLITIIRGGNTFGAGSSA